MALQEGVAMHLEAIQSSRQSSPGDLADPLHALKGAAGMYGARRLHGLAAALEAEVLRGGSVEDLGHSLDRIERVGRLTIAAVNSLLDEIAATEEDAREPR
jgi:HPt (histidine-containing phosphotransfer) domain-containing protein